jgi:hypothetical protein
VGAVGWGLDKQQQRKVENLKLEFQVDSTRTRSRDTAWWLPPGLDISIREMGGL